MRVPRRAVGFAAALGQQLPVDDASEGGGPALLVDGGRVLQVHQVVVRLAHARVLPLVSPPEEQLGALAEEAACGHTQGGQEGV